MFRRRAGVKDCGEIDLLGGTHWILNVVVFNLQDGGDTKAFIT